MKGLETLIALGVKKHTPVVVTSGKVTAVNGAVCSVGREGFADLEGVRLNSIDVAEGTYFIVTPKIGSIVQVALIENVETEAVVIATSEVDKVEIVLPNDMKLLFDKDGFVLNGGVNQGMVKSPVLESELAKNNAILQGILSVLSTPINEAGNGAPSAFQAALNGVVGSLPVGDFSAIQNNKVKH